MATSPRSTQPDTGEQLTLSPEVSPVNHTPLPGSSEARKMTALSGRRCSALLMSAGPVGLLVKMLVGSSRWRSTIVNLRWTPKALLLERSETYIIEWDEELQKKRWKRSKKKDTKSRLLSFQLAALKPTKNATGRGLLGTMRASDGMTHKLRRGVVNPRGRLEDQIARELYPALTREEGNRCVRQERQSDPHRNLTAALSRELLPAITVNDAGNSTLPPSQLERSSIIGYAMRAGEVGYMNPEWCELYMGFPAGWTDLESMPSETPSSPR